jgi:hypothetical protein
VKSDLQLKRYSSLKFQGPICDFGKWLGLYLEILLNSRGDVRNFIGLRLDFKQKQGPLCEDSFSMV